MLLAPLGGVLLSQDPAVQVPSALEGLTVVFGMGTRGSLPPSPPNDENCLLPFQKKKEPRTSYRKRLALSKLTTSERQAGFWNLAIPI